MTALMKSCVDDRIPPAKNKTRATVHIMAIVCKPDTDAEGNDITHCMMVINTDINGLVPKWIVNMASRTAPMQWFNDCQKAVDNFAAGKYSVKPEDVTDWKTGAFQ